MAKGQGDLWGFWGLEGCEISQDFDQWQFEEALAYCYWLVLYM